MRSNLIVIVVSSCIALSPMSTLRVLTPSLFFYRNIKPLNLSYPGDNRSTSIQITSKLIIMGNSEGHLKLFERVECLYFCVHGKDIFHKFICLVVLMIYGGKNVVYNGPKVTTLT